MASKSTPPPPPAAADQQQQQQQQPLLKQTLPLKEYFSTLAYLSLLVTITTAFLPRSTRYFYPDAAVAQKTSADRPEHPFLTPITANPTASAAWIAAGTGVTVAWLGNRFARWVGHRGTTVLAVAIATPLYAAVAHLLGAPGYTWFRTLVVSLHLALLTVWIPISILGFPSPYDDGIADRYRMTRMFSQWTAETRLETLVLYPTVGALIGAWLGAIPMALDWDRPWQAWPLAPLVASLLGFVVGGYAGWASCALKGLKSEIAAEQRRESTKNDRPRTSGGARRRKPGK